MPLDPSKIQDYFQKALIFFMAREKNQSVFAKKVDTPISTISSIKRSISGSSEELRRKIATALGYPGPHYEDFLEIGRAISTGESPNLLIESHADIGLGNPFQDLDWLFAHVDALKSLDLTGQKAVIAVIYAFKK
jgi:hypothetical protein